ncbi:MAG: hypothetical protein IKU90_03065 [Clostridia bacterium]|nr:hypothetical protein [Clostridia bacterium]
MEYVTENGESFLRITSLGGEDALPMAYSSKYPKNVLGDNISFLVVKYRTSYAEGEDLGVIYRTVHQTEYDPYNCYYEYIESDGQWHTVVFYMDEEASWTHYIMNIGFVPFPYAEDSARQTIDIAWMKFYVDDPTDIYGDEEQSGDPGENGDETEVPVVDETTALEGDVTAAPDDQTAAETTASDETAAPEATNEADETEAPKGGCGAVAGIGLATLLTAMAAAVVLKKKD